MITMLQLLKSTLFSERYSELIWQQTEPGFNCKKMEHSIRSGINVMLCKGKYSLFCDIYSEQSFYLKLKLGKFHDYLAFCCNNDAGVWTSGFLHTKIPHWRVVWDKDVAFKLLLFMVQQLRICNLKDIRFLVGMCNKDNFEPSNLWLV